MTERFKNKAGGSRLEGDGELIFIRPSDLGRAGFEGVLVEGVLEEVLVNRYDETKSDFRILVDAPTIIKGQTKEGEKYEREVKAGDTAVINGAGNLGYLMSEVTTGSLCQISYKGMALIEKGPRKGTKAHNFEVLYE